MWWLVVGKHVLNPHNTAQISVTKHEVHTMILVIIALGWIYTQTHTDTDTDTHKHTHINTYIPIHKQAYTQANTHVSPRRGKEKMKGKRPTIKNHANVLCAYSLFVHILPNILLFNFLKVISATYRK